MRSAPRRLSALACALALVLALAGCVPQSAPSASPSASPTPAPSAPIDETPVSLTVVGMPPGASAASQQRLIDAVASFQKANPHITVSTRQYEWVAASFVTDLAGGMLPDVFEIPFPDARVRAADKQLADLTDLLGHFPFNGAFNPNLLQPAAAADGRVYAVPAEAVYGVGLHYHRGLFAQAGLDPDKPPTSWDEVRAYAKQIADQTEADGLAVPTVDGAGGWQVAAASFARGGSLTVIGVDGSVTATLANPATRAALQFWKDLRWTDGSLAAQDGLDPDAVLQAFANGQLGMLVAAQDAFGALVREGLAPADYGLTMIPLEGEGSGVLGGGWLAAVKPGVDERVKAAAAKWISYWYLGRYASEQAAQEWAQAALAANQPVGVPELPLFTEDGIAQYHRWIAPYATVPANQSMGFTTQINTARIVIEPPVATHEVYTALDVVVRAVLTDQNADLDRLLADANLVAQQAINAAQ